MPEQPRRGLQTWIVVLTPIVGPFVIAFLFSVALDLVRIPNDQRLTVPNAGYEQANRDEEVVVMYWLAQLAFVIVVPWRMTRRVGVRAVFVAIAFPLSFILSILAVAAHIAR